MYSQREIQVSEGKQISLLKFPTKSLKGILQLLHQNYYLIKGIDQNTFDINQAKNFLRRVTPFMLNAFISYLKTNPQYKEILQDIQILKEQKESKQQKFELKDLRQLLKQEKGEVVTFYQAFHTFLQSFFLQQYIQNNKKISNQEYKQLYLKSIQLFLEEIEKKQQIFVKFISDTNVKKIVEYWNEIKNSQNSQNNSFISVESIPNGDDQTPYLDQEPGKGNFLGTPTYDPEIFFDMDLESQIFSTTTLKKLAD